jgi:hypothetical protein
VRGRCLELRPSKRLPTPKNAKKIQSLSDE